VCSRNALYKSTFYLLTTLTLIPNPNTNPNPNHIINSNHNPYPNPNRNPTVITDPQLGPIDPQIVTVQIRSAFCPVPQIILYAFLR